MTYRDRNEIISQILESARAGGITKTRIMYKAYLSYDQLEEYLVLLIENDLLRYDSPMHKFKTTEKGLAFLQAYNQIDRILKEHDNLSK